MLEAEVQVFAIALEVYFSRPRPFAKDKIDELAGWLTDAAEGLALRAEQVRVRHTDLLEVSKVVGVGLKLACLLALMMSRGIEAARGRSRCFHACCKI